MLPPEVQAEPEAWLKRVVSIAGGAYDFFGFNAITTDDRNYYKNAH